GGGGGGGAEGGGAAVARAIDTEPCRIDLGLAAEERERGLHVGHPAVRRQAAARSLAVAPALVVEHEHDIARLVEHARVVGQVEVLDARVAVAQYDARASRAGLQAVRIVEVANEPEALAVEVNGLFHGVSSRQALTVRSISSRCSRRWLARTSVIGEPDAVLRRTRSSGSAATFRSVASAIATARSAARRGASARNIGLAASLIQSTFASPKSTGATPSRCQRSRS